MIIVSKDKSYNLISLRGVHANRGINDNVKSACTLTKFLILATIYT